MRVVLLPCVVLLVGCAHEEVERRRPSSTDSTQLEFTTLRGQALELVLVDRQGLFTDSLETWNTARTSVERQLTNAEVRVENGSPKRLVLQVFDGGRDALSPDCIRVDAHVEVAAQPFMPTSSTSARRCAGSSTVPTAPGALAESATIVTAIADLVAQGIRAANGETAKRRAEALFAATSAVLASVDNQTRYSQ